MPPKIKVVNIYIFYYYFCYCLIMLQLQTLIKIEKCLSFDLDFNWNSLFYLNHKKSILKISNNKRNNIEILFDKNND